MSVLSDILKENQALFEKEAQKKISEIWNGRIDGL